MCVDFLAFYLAGPLPGGWLGIVGALAIFCGFVVVLGVGRVAAWLAGALAVCAGIIGFAWLCSHFSSGVIALCAGVVAIVCFGLVAWAEKK